MTEGCVRIFRAYTRGCSQPPASPRADGGQHLMVSLCDLAPVSSEAVICCQLYSQSREVWVSERWCALRPGAACSGSPALSASPASAGDQSTLFSDVGSDLGGDLYCVVTVYRLGKIMNQQTELQNRRSQSGRWLTVDHGLNVATSLHKRPVSVGVCPLSSIISGGQKVCSDHEMTETVKMFSCDEKDHHKLHSWIIKGNGKVIHPPPSGPHNIVLKMRLFPGLLQEIREHNEILENFSETRKLGFGHVVMPGDFRNDLFVTIVRGTFDRGKPGTSGRNIEVMMIVSDGEGNEIPGAVVSSSGAGSGCLNPAVLCHNNTPVWDEVFRLDLGVETFQRPGTHLRLEYYHCSLKERQERKLVGFSWLELMRDDGTVIMDGEHELGVFRAEAMSGLSYLSGGGTGPVRSGKESVVIRTQLVSTKLTQNVDLMRLLNWRASTDTIPSILASVTNTGGDEIVKFLTDVLDALFSMFVTEDGNSTPHSGQVFHALCHILVILKDPKYESFQSVIDTYLQDHFAAALVYKGLMSCVRHCADMVPSTERQDPIRKCFQSLHHVFRFIVSSRQLFSRAMGGQSEDSFRVEIHLLFNSFNKMLSYNSETVLPTQIAFLLNLSSVYPSLLVVMPVIDLSKLVTLTLGSLAAASSHRLLRRAALTAAREAVTSSIWADPPSRVLLLPSCLEHIANHLQLREELQVATDILLDMLELLRVEEDRSRTSVMYRTVSLLAEMVLNPLGVAIIAEQETVQDTTNPEELGIVRLTACFLGILELVNLLEPGLLWMSDPGRVFIVLTELVTRPSFPSEWATFSLSLVNTVQCTIRQTSEHLIQQHHFDKLLWMSFFRLASSFVTSPLLAVEAMRRQGRFTSDLHTIENVRTSLTENIVDSWMKCPQQILLVPSLVGPLLELVLMPIREIRQKIVPVLISMMEVEQNTRGTFKQMETELIDKMDMFINENREDEEYHEVFNSLMLDLTQQLAPASQGSVFVSSVSTLLERLLDYRGTLEGEHNRNKRMTCTVNLLKFYKDDITRQELYIRYIYKLHDLHLAAHNYAEAGFTLQLHAGHLDWSTRMLHADLQFPTQQEWQRKEQLYGQIIALFDKSKLWEFAVPLCKELCDLYENRIHDYYKLSNILTLQASAFQNILATFRPHPEYFKVSFLGTSYPLFVRNKEFIYRGLDFEKISDFTQRLCLEFPEAKLFTKNSASEEFLSEQDSQHLVICSVRPVKQDTAAYMGPSVPDRVRDFYSVNKVSRFVYDRPFHKGSQDPENEFTSLWLERTVFTTSSEFPGILKWFEVSGKEVTLVSPIQFAVETMEGKNEELQTLMRDFTEDKNKTLSPLTMRLQGNIDAAVNGGVAKYRKAFFCPEYLASHPGEYNQVECLAGLIEEQGKLLGEVLDLHGQLASEALQPLHERLVELYQDMRDWMAKTSLMSSVSRGRVRMASIVNTPLPPLPLSSVDSGLGSELTHGYGHIKENEDSDNCYHEVIIGDPCPPALPSTPQPRVAPPLPPRGVRTSLTMSPPHTNTSPLLDSYTYIPAPSSAPAVPTRLSTFQGSPPPLMRKSSGRKPPPPPPVPPKSVSASDNGSDT